MKSAPDPPAESGGTSLASLGEATPKWRMRSTPAESPAQAEAPSWRMSTGSAGSTGVTSSGTTSSEAEARSTPEAPAFSPIFTSGEDLPVPRPSARVVSGVVPTHGEQEFGRLPELVPVEPTPGVPSDHYRPDTATAELGGFEPLGGRTPIAQQAPPQPVWENRFVDTLVLTRRRRAASTSPNAPNAWSYPESGGYATGESMGSTGYEAPRGRNLVLSDASPEYGSYISDETEAEESVDPWFRVGQTEEYQQDPWRARYSAMRYRGATIPSRFGSVMGEVRHHHPPHVRTVYEEHHPAGPYAYDFDVDDPFADEEELMALGRTRFRIQAGVPPLRQWYDPGQAHLKAGNLYLQALWLEAGFVYSGYSGNHTFPQGQGDGWLGYTSFAMRGAARLFRDVYFIVNGEIIYLFGENKLGFRALETVSGPSALAMVEYTAQWGEWDVYIFDRLGTATFFDIDFLVQDDVFERAGRYHLGYPGDYRASRFFLYDPILYNQIGIKGSREIDEILQTQAWYTHTDYFYPDYNQRHRHRENIGASIGAQPRTIPFTPTFTYQGISSDHFDSMAHALYLSGSGALSERLALTARGGYLWTDDFPVDQDHWLWALQLRHRLTSKTSHALSAGQDYMWREEIDDSAVADYLRYDISHRVSNSLYLGAFAQWSNHRFLTGDFTNREFHTEAIGVRVDFQVMDDLFLDFGYRHENSEERRFDTETTREIIHATAYMRLTERSVAYLGYQFEEFESNASFFDEHLWKGGVRRYF